MKVLVSCQHYWPEPFNTSDVCEELVRRGHEVMVLTAMPNTGLPGNVIPERYEGLRLIQEEHNGVRIMRVALHPRKSGSLNRILNYLSFWRNAKKAALDIDEKFDVVLGYQFSPVMQVDPGIAYARKHGVKVLLYCFDLWPASLLAGGFKETSLSFKWMKSVSKRIYSSADRIAVTSPMFDEYFREVLELDIPDSAYLPQYAEGCFLEDAFPADAGYDLTKVNLTFAGNVGKAQSVGTIIEAAALMPRDSSVVFHIVGSGSDLESCKGIVEGYGLHNVVFHGRKSVEEMPSYYAASDAMLVSLADSPMAKYTLPRKVTTYLAAGKPILAALSGETGRVISDAQCGLSCDADDAASLARICMRFEDSGEKDSWGKSARSYYRRHFAKEHFFETMEELLYELTEGEDERVR